MTTTPAGFMKRVALLGVSIGSMAASVQCPRPTNTTATIMCGDFSVWVREGTCEALTNTCGDGRWVHPPDYAGFRIEGAPASVYVRTERTGRELTGVSLCAASGAGNIVDDNAVFTYGSGDSFGNGHVAIVVSPPLVAEVSATPEVIDPGGTSQLVATVSGGIPPYSYSWIPTTGLNQANIPLPIASAASTTTYTLDVSDSVGHSAGQSPGQNPPSGPRPTVTVRVNRQLEVTASPPAIALRDVSQLNVRMLGGLPPYTYSWVPADTLDNPTISNPSAQPTETTTYTVTATDADGATSTGSVQVAIVAPLSANPTATPATIDAGQPSQLDAQPSGGDGHYTYAWSPESGLTNPAIRNPVASPSTTTTYAVTVIDGRGQSVTGQVPVTVNAATQAPTATFTFLRGAPDTGASTLHWTFNASASAGNIVSYGRATGGISSAATARSSIR
jgi:hypothetical protein